MPGYNIVQSHERSQNAIQFPDDMNDPPVRDTLYRICTGTFQDSRHIVRVLNSDLIELLFPRHCEDVA